eukprot:4020066-Pyramimonas_sp.AAC.1
MFFQVKRGWTPADKGVAVADSGAHSSSDSSENDAGTMCRERRTSKMSQDSLKTAQDSRAWL